MARCLALADGSAALQRSACLETRAPKVNFYDLLGLKSSLYDYSNPIVVLATKSDSSRPGWRKLHWPLTTV